MSDHPSLVPMNRIVEPRVAFARFARIYNHKLRLARAVYGEEPSK